MNRLFQVLMGIYVFRGIYFKLRKALLASMVWRKRRNDRQQSATEPLRVNLGGGVFLRKGWKSLDYVSDWYSYTPTHIDYRHDLWSGKPLPFEDNSVSFFYTSHTFEHIPHEHCAFILAEIYRALKPGGAIRITTPDYDVFYDAFERNDWEFLDPKDPIFTGGIEQALVFSFASGICDKVGPEEIRQKAAAMTREAFADHFTSRVDREWQRQNCGYHINWWNYTKAERCLRAAGFEKIYRSTPQGSQFADMRGVERIFGLEKLFDARDWLGFDVKIPDRSLFVEAVKLGRA